MKRITISLPEDLAATLLRESKRRQMSVSEVARMAIEGHLPRPKEVDGKRFVPFASLGRSGHGTLARHMEEILAREWTKENLIDRDR